MPEEIKIRFATIEDLPSMVEIYNQAIRAGNATADRTEFEPHEKEQWFYEHDQKTFPLYLIEVNNEIAGWGSVSPYRKGREALRLAGEITYYIHYDFHGRGLGNKLLRFMIEDCKRTGIKYLLAFLLEINTPSIAILKKFDFEEWGRLRDIVDLDGVKCSHLLYGRKVY